MVTNTVELFALDFASVGESPIYDDADRSLRWVDLTAGVLNRRDYEGGRSSAVVSDLLGAVALTVADEQLAAIGRDGFGYVEGDRFRAVATIDPHPDFRMNDAKPDSRGRLWGNRTHRAFQPGTGSLHVWSGGDECRTVATGFGLPNGIGWSPDDRTMYLIDSTARTLLAAPFDLDDGSAGEFRSLAAIDGGLPDGLAVDVEGCLWVAVWGAARVDRISPSGELVSSLPVPVSQPSSCAFGADGELYITSARADLSAERLAREPWAGSVLVADVGVAGVPVARFEDAG